MIKYYLKDGEQFYGGAINDALQMPFDKSSVYEINLVDWHSGNQACGLLFSNLGNVFYSDVPFKFGFYKGELYILSDDVKQYYVTGNLQEIHQWIVDNLFTKIDNIPPIEMFKNPTFNTWIEMGKNVTQLKALKYANDIIKNGYKPGVLIIDDCWSINYGDWDFDFNKFSNPNEMIDQLHKLGFKVILWICPFIDFQSNAYNECQKLNILVKNKDGSIYQSHWWNGVSSVLDLSNSSAICWVKSQLSRLKNHYNVDGFKFDAGDPEWYRGEAIFNNGLIGDQAKFWCKLGEEYAYSELRVGFNNGISGCVHRLRDKYHSWDKDGLNTLIPNAIMMGLFGYPFLCPDMIGGGVLPDFEDKDFKFDEELFIRYAQVSALMPMMQFSLAPWKCLNKTNQIICLEAVSIHEKYLPIILSLINEAKNGKPIIRSMAYQENSNKYIDIKDQFFLGDDILVCPQLTKSKTRKIVLPDGKWQSNAGKVYNQGEYIIEVLLNELPIYKRIK